MTNTATQHIAHSFAGDVSSAEVWQALSSNPQAQLVDVRTQPEWAYAGIADLSSLNKKTLTISWKFYPTFQGNAEFLLQLQAQVPDASTPLYFICKTGGRSTDAAIAATQAGYAQCFNVEGGFEGEANTARQRGHINGWKAAQLPWEQA